MKAKAKLIFSDDGKTGCIQFANGAEFYYESKEEGLFALRRALGKKKITPNEAQNLFKEIILAENLPDRDLTFILPFVIMDMMREILGETDEIERIESPYAELCKCKLPHAYLHNGDGTKISPPFQFKTDGRAYVEYLLKNGRITKGDSDSLNTRISMLLLPENASLN